MRRQRGGTSERRLRGQRRHAWRHRQWLRPTTLAVCVLRSSAASRSCRTIAPTACARPARPRQAGAENPSSHTSQQKALHNTTTAKTFDRTTCRLAWAWVVVGRLPVQCCLENPSLASQARQRRPFVSAEEGEGGRRVHHGSRPRKGLIAVERQCSSGAVVAAAAVAVTEPASGASGCWGRHAPPMSCRRARRFRGVACSRQFLCCE